MARSGGADHGSGGEGFDAALPTEAALEDPNTPAKPKGLVKRSMFLWAAGILVVFLVIAAARDITRGSLNPQTSAGAAGPAGSASNPASAPDFRAPNLTDIDAEVARQKGLVKAAGAASAPVEPNLPAAGGPAAPNPNAPNAGGRSPSADGSGSGTRALSAAGIGGGSAGSSSAFEDDDIGTRNASQITALDGGDVPTATGNGSGARLGEPNNVSGIPGFDDAAVRKAEEEAQRQQAAAQSQQADLIRAMTQGQNKGPVVTAHRTTSDRDWLRQQQATAEPIQVNQAKPLPTRNVVLKGTRVPVVSLEAVNSDLPGTLTARATSDVYDSLTQTRLLIPKGTRFNLSYSSEVKPGQARVLMASSRMVRQDGLVVDLSGSQGADRLGRAGLEGRVNNHFLKMFGYSLATALISYKADNQGLASNTTTNGVTSAGSVAGQVLGDISQRILQRNAEIPPTITLPIGQPFYIVFSVDVALPTYGEAQ